MINTADFFKFRESAKWTGTFRQSQARWIAKTVRPLEPVAGLLARGYAEAARRRGYIKANEQLREVSAQLQRHDLNLSWADDELCRWCEGKAQKAVPLLREAERTDQPEKVTSVIMAATVMVGRYGIKLPDVKVLGPLPVLRRLTDAAWWRKQARRLQAREVERIAIIMGRVRRDGEVYCSDETVRRRSAQRWRNRKYLEATEAENQDGQRYTLAELADLSVSNPRIRRGELMMRVRGFDEAAELLGHVREFWTLTSPSRFHRWTTAGGSIRENTKWGRLMPTDAQRWLSDVWAKVRAKLARVGIRLYGFRVVEAHHDGTPHWHAAIFYTPVWQVKARYSVWPREDDKNGKPVRAWEWDQDELNRAAAPRVRAIVRRYFINGTQESDALDRGAKERRVKFETIDPEKGDAAGYLAKYITKAIDATDAGDLVQQDLYGYDMGDSARRVEAWAACNGVRQFQQVGGPSVTAWREMRRATGSDVTQADLFDAPQVVQRAAEAADEGDWMAFVLLMGGPMVKRKDQPARLGYWHEHDAETGEVIGQVFDRYGGEAKARIYGLTHSGGEGHILTRVHSWTIHRPGEERPEAEPAPEFHADTRAAERAARDATEWRPWAFDVLEAVDFGADRFSGGAAAPPLESCQ